MDLRRPLSMLFSTFILHQVNEYINKFTRSVTKLIFVISGRVPELLINSKKASTFHIFDEHIKRFLRFRFSMIQTHDFFLKATGKVPCMGLQYEIMLKVKKALFL